jgi:hypothetical protein
MLPGIAVNVTHFLAPEGQSDLKACAMAPAERLAAEVETAPALVRIRRPLLPFLNDRAQ